jgi:hypothetical protein
LGGETLEMLVVVAPQSATPGWETVSVPGLVGVTVTVAVPPGPSRMVWRIPGPLSVSSVPAGAGVPLWLAMMVMVCGCLVADRLPLIETVRQIVGLGGAGVGGAGVGGAGVGGAAG